MLKLRNAAMNQILDHYEKQPEMFGCIRYDHYLAYVPSGPQVDRPDTWVIGLLERDGGYLIPQRIHKRYLGVMLLGASLALLVIGGCLVWFFLVFGGPFSADVNAIIAGMTLFVGPLAVGGIVSWPLRRRITKSYQWIEFPEGLARALAAIDGKKARQGWG